MPIKNNGLFGSLSLDAVVESILDKMHEHTPSFLMESEKIQKGRPKDTQGSLIVNTGSYILVTITK